MITESTHVTHGAQINKLPDFVFYESLIKGSKENNLKQ